MPNVDSEKINIGYCKFIYLLHIYIIKYNSCGYYNIIIKAILTHQTIINVWILNVTFICILSIT